MSNDTTTDDSTAMKEVATGGDTATVDLQDLVEDLEAEAEDLREQCEQAQDDSDVSWPPEGYAGMDRPDLELQHNADLVRNDIERFGGSEFVIRKARAGEIARANDLVAQDTMQTDGDAAAKVSASRHRLVQVCLEQVPPETPQGATGEVKTAAFETPTFNYLHDRIENFNKYGQLSVEDF